MSARPRSLCSLKQSGLINVLSAIAADLPPLKMPPAMRKAHSLIPKSDDESAANLIASTGRESQVRIASGEGRIRRGRLHHAVSDFRLFFSMHRSVIKRPGISNAHQRTVAIDFELEEFDVQVRRQRSVAPGKTRMTAPEVAA